MMESTESFNRRNAWKDIIDYYNNNDTFSGFIFDYYTIVFKNVLDFCKEYATDDKTRPRLRHFIHSILGTYHAYYYYVSVM